MFRRSERVGNLFTIKDLAEADPSLVSNYSTQVRRLGESIDAGAIGPSRVAMGCALAVTLDGLGYPLRLGAAIAVTVTGADYWTVERCVQQSFRYEMHGTALFLEAPYSQEQYQRAREAIQGNHAIMSNVKAVQNARLLRNEIATIEFGRACAQRD